MKSYRELIQIPSFHDRYIYLKLDGRVGSATFGSRRSLNQMLYKYPEWRRIRNLVIERDKACDLAHRDFEINNQPAYIHHINPITIEDILNRDPKIFDMNNLITTTFDTHQAIHYGSEALLPALPIERRPNDTCPWR
jgi:hypothetical protein